MERYIALRQTLGFKLRDLSFNLNAFARFAAERGDTHVRVSTAVEWATGGSSPHARYIRLRDVARLARVLHAEDPTHDVPINPFYAPMRRLLPYIYKPEEIVQLVEAAGRLRETYPHRRQVYATLLGLIAATGLRISEALDLRVHDVLPDGALQIRRTKFGKGRLIPLAGQTNEGFTDYHNERDALEQIQSDVVKKYGSDDVTLNVFLQELDLVEKSE